MDKIKTLFRFFRNEKFRRGIAGVEIIVLAAIALGIAVTARVVQNRTVPQNLQSEAAEGKCAKPKLDDGKSCDDDCDCKNGLCKDDKCVNDCDKNYQNNTPCRSDCQCKSNFCNSKGLCEDATHKCNQDSDKQCIDKNTGDGCGAGMICGKKGEATNPPFECQCKPIGSSEPTITHTPGTTETPISRTPTPTSQGSQPPEITNTPSPTTSSEPAATYTPSPTLAPGACGITASNTVVTEETPALLMIEAPDNTNYKHFYYLLYNDQNEGKPICVKNTIEGNIDVSDIIPANCPDGSFQLIFKDTDTQSRNKSGRHMNLDQFSVFDQNFGGNKNKIATVKPVFSNDNITFTEPSCGITIQTEDYPGEGGPPTASGDIDWYAPDGDKCRLTDYLRYFETADCSGQPAGYTTEGIEPVAECTQNSANCYKLAGEIVSKNTGSYNREAIGGCAQVAPGTMDLSSFLYKCNWGYAPEGTISGKLTVVFSNIDDFDMVYVWLRDLSTTTTLTSEKRFVLFDKDSTDEETKQIISSIPKTFFFNRLYLDRNYELYAKAYKKQSGGGNVELEAANISFAVCQAGNITPTPIPQGDPDLLTCRMLLTPTSKGGTAEIKIQFPESSGGTLSTLSTNDAFNEIMDLWSDGEIGALEVSSFINQLTRTPSLQKGICDPRIEGGCEAE